MATRESLGKPKNTKTLDCTRAEKPASGPDDFGRDDPILVHGLSLADVLAAVDAALAEDEADADRTP